MRHLVWFEMQTSKAVSAVQGDPWEKAVQGAQGVQRKEAVFTGHGGGWETPPQEVSLELKAAPLFWRTNLRFRNKDDTCKASYAV